MKFRQIFNEISLELAVEWQITESVMCAARIACGTVSASHVTSRVVQEREMPFSTTQKS
jgi:hypothetical protein